MEQIEGLRDAVMRLTREVATLRREFRRRTVAIVLVAAALVTAGLIITRVQLDNDRRLDASNKRWCPVMTLLVPRPGDPPATTERARLLAERARIIADQFHC